MTSDFKSRNPQYNSRVLTGSMFDFSKPTGPDILARTQSFEDWRHERSQHGLWPFSRVLKDAPRAGMEIVDEAGLQGGKGVSLSCQDYLGLTSHPAIHEAVIKALKDFGPHSAGSPALAGNTPLSLQLEKEIGDALGFESVALFPTGWGAGYGTITGLIRPEDHIVMDQLSHACLQQGVQASTRNIHRHTHLSIEAVRETLKKIRSTDTRNGIMVITEGLFSMDSDVPDLAALQNVCREYGAILMVDVAHDFGSLGANGGGSLEIQNLLGKVDLVMGSFSKTFASNGGFLATHNESVRQYIKFFSSPQTFSNALSPIQSSVVLAALKIVRSEEGAKLRETLLKNVAFLREGLESRNINCIGTDSAIVPAHIGNEAIARIAWSKLTEKGIHTNLVEFPAVAVGSARFRMQLMPSHTEEQLSYVADETAKAIAEAVKAVEQMPPLPERKRTRLALGPELFNLASKSLPSLHATDLNKIFSNSKVENFKEGTTVLKEGSQSRKLYFVRKGRASVELEFKDEPLIIAECVEGDIFGEMSMLDGQYASASVVATTDLEVATIENSDLTALIQAEPDVGSRLYHSIAVILAKRIRASNIQLFPEDSFG